MKVKKKKKTRTAEQTKPGIFSSSRFKMSLRLLLAVALASVSVILIWIGRQPGFRLKYTLHEGDIAPRAIYAERDFSYVSEKKTKAKRRELAARINDVYDLDHKAINGAIEKIEKFFSDLRQLPTDVSFDELKKINLLGLSETSLNWLNELGREERVGSGAVEILKSILGAGVLARTDKNELIKRNVSTIVVRNPLDGTEFHQDIGELLTLDSAKRRIPSEVMSSFPEERRLRLALTELLKRCLVPSLRYNQGETENRRDQVEESTPLEYNYVKKGELIIDKGQRVTSEHLTQLWHSSLEKHRFAQLPSLLATMLLVSTCLGISVFYLKKFYPSVYYKTKYLVLISLLVVSILLIGKSVVVSPASSYLIPVSFVSMIIAIMVNSQVAVVITSLVCILIAVMAGGKLDLFTCCLVGGLVAIYLVHGVRRRSHLLRAGFFVGVANFICIISFGMVNREYDLILRESGWGVGNGIISAFLVAGALPIFEYLFKITTDISLLELSDLNHPLLKKLLLEAPGTYHHSLLVSNLSESAAEAIGANPLLARVGAYFHDIGKIEKSEYFDENQKGDSKHDKLSPSMSSLIIINHVKDGVELALKFKLNEAIVDIIRQHHGTGLVSFFYQRALESNSDSEKFTQTAEQPFRYPGPKPQTREAAMVLLADSAEAASRALSDPTPSSIRGVVQKVINNKFIDGQLDECDLTLKDLHKIADTFVHILTGIYHSRVGYEAKELARTKKVTSSNGKNKKSSKEG